MEKNPASHIVRNNLLAVLSAAVVLGLAGRFVSDSATVIFGVLYLGLVGVNFLLGLYQLVSKNPEARAAPYFLSMLLVLIIGFGTCAGMLTFTNLNIH